MKKERNKIICALIGGVVFNLIFWNEKIAFNSFIYDAIILASLFFSYPQARHSSTVRWLTLGHLVCLAMIFVNNTVLSKIGSFITLGLIVGFAEYQHRSAWYAGGSAILNGIFGPASIADALSFQSTITQPRKKITGKIIRIAIIPLLIALVFYIVYSSANTVFSRIFQNMFDWIDKTISNFFNSVSFKRFFFLLGGIYLSCWILLKSSLNFFEKKEDRCDDQLIRRRKTVKERNNDFLANLASGLMGRLGRGALVLKNMNTVGLISLILLNLMLFVVNAIDIIYIWFGFEYNKDVDLFKMIHEGTDMLIISILMAMIILIIFFRGNLNFYKGNKWLTYASYAWLLQNTILVISVFLRDYYYINQTGLAYKRIGVLFYLLLVLTGLITVFWKIYRKKTTYYLFRVNAWAVVTLLVLSTTVNWDELIASYNFSRKDNILMPVDYMLTLSNRALPLLQKNATVLEGQIRKQNKLGFTTETCEACVLPKLLEKKVEFNKEQEGLTWLSYNLADESIKEFYSRSNQYSAK